MEDVHSRRPELINEMTSDRFMRSLIGSSPNTLFAEVQERAASFEKCPWCAAKGLTCALRTYRINFHESITLCTSPQCLFPLVSQPLEDVLASLVPTGPQTGGKRKIHCGLEMEDSLLSTKRLRFEEAEETIKAVPLRGKELSAPEPDALPAEAVAATAEELPAPEKVLPASLERFHAPEVATLLEVAPLPVVDSVEKLPVPEKELPAPVELPDAEAVPLPGKKLSAPDEDLPAPEAGSLPGKEVPAMEEDLYPIAEDENPSPMTWDEEDLPAMEESEEVGHPPELLCRPCSVDLSQSRVEDELEGSTAEDEGDSTDKQEVTSLVEPLVTIPQRDRRKHKKITDQQETTSEVKQDPKTGLLDSVVISTGELVHVPPHLFWRNENNLCWLDTLLVFLVKCRTLRGTRPRDQPKRSPIWDLCEGYDQACALITQHQQTGKDGIVRVPSEVLQRVMTELHVHRMVIFNLLKPKLQCKLGQNETPVFAMPLLLKQDSWAEPLFDLAYEWEFECTRCKHSTNFKRKMTLPTFTKVMSDWHPLNAVHKARCSKCYNQKQTRMMVLERVCPVFALHFVEGLPDNDVSIYSFSFQGKCYSVTTVIQYDQQLKHFVTWVRQLDGSWLEFDDLKHPNLFIHSQLAIPAKDIHVVFWEMETDGENTKTCSFSQSLSEKYLTDEPVQLSVQSHLSFPIPHNDTAIIEALTVSDDTENDQDSTVTASVDASIGSTTLLETFEGLSHNDIVTLTLVEVKVDSMGKSLDNNTPVPENSLVPEMASEFASEMSMSPESTNELPPDPTPKPAPSSPPKPRRGRSRTTIKAIAPAPAPPVSPNPSRKSPTHCNLFPEKPDLPPAPDPNTRWSYLLSRHSNTSTPTPNSRPPPSNHSTPNPLWPPQHPRYANPKADFRKEDNKALPVKAAEMFRGFHAKSMNNPTQSMTSPPTQLSSQRIAQVLHQNTVSKLQPAAFIPRNPPVNTTVVSMKSPPPGVTELPKITSKKHGSHASKLPPGLSDTEVLRYKLLMKLKAKKKKLQKLNQMLEHKVGVESTPKPDSTELGSPYTVSSSTSVYDSLAYDEFFADLLSPATTASNLSPDSTGYLEMLTNGQEGGGDFAYEGNAIGGSSHMNSVNSQPASHVAAVSQPAIDGPIMTTNKFLDEFISGSTIQQTAMDTEALGELDLFF